MRNLLKSTVGVIIILFSVQYVNAQQFYMTTNVGFGIPANKNIEIFENLTSTSYRDLSGKYTRSNTYEKVSFSLGRGLNFGGSVGYMFNDYIGIDVGLNYLWGGKNQTTETNIQSNEVPGNVFKYERIRVSDYYARMFRVIPSIIITPNFEGLNPYLKFGTVLSFGSFYKELNGTNTDNSPGGQNSKSFQKDIYSGGIGIGLNLCVGADYDLSEKLSVFGEFNYLGLNYAPNTRETIESTYNGVDNLSRMSTARKKTNFKSEYSNAGGFANMDEPSTEIKTSYNVSSIGLNLGIKLSF